MNERGDRHQVAPVGGCNFGHQLTAGIPLRVVPITHGRGGLGDHQLLSLQGLQNRRCNLSSNVDASRELFLRSQPLRVLRQQQQGLQLRHRIDPLGEELQDAGGNLR